LVKKIQQIFSTSGDIRQKRKSQISILFFYHFIID